MPLNRLLQYNEDEEKYANKPLLLLTTTITTIVIIGLVLIAIWI